MPSWIADLVRLEGGDGVYRTATALGAGPRLIGGLIAAQALAAAAATVPPDRLPQSLHAYFIMGGRVGVDVEYTVETTREECHTVIERACLAIGVVAPSRITNAHEYG
jgi:acyl-CoA thioesterase II